MHARVHCKFQPVIRTKNIIPKYTSSIRGQHPPHRASPPSNEDRTSEELPPLGEVFNAIQDVPNQGTWDEEEEDIEDIFGPPAVIIAGFELAEMAAIRLILDKAGANTLPVIPVTKKLLRMPAVHGAHPKFEPKWEESAHHDWASGGGWGKQRTILFSGLSVEDQAVVWTLLDAHGLTGVTFDSLDREDAEEPLGEVLGRLVTFDRQDDKEFRDSVGENSQEPSSTEAYSVRQPTEDERKDIIISNRERKRRYSDTYAPILEEDDLSDDFIIDRLAGSVDVPEPSVVQLDHFKAALERSGFDMDDDTEDEGINDLVATEVSNVVMTSSSQGQKNVRTGNDEIRDPVTLPDPEEFVLRKDQLKETAEKFNLNYEAILATIEAQGIDLR